MRHRKKNSAGFTLIEMLVAMALMLMLSGMLFQVFTSAREVSRKSDACIEIYQNARCMFDFLERDLSGAVLVGKTTSFPDGRYFELCNDDEGAVSDDAGVPHYHDSIRLVSRSIAKYGEIVEVGYYLTVDTTDSRKSELKRYYDHAGTNPSTGDDLDVSVGATVWDGFYKSDDVVARGVTDLNIDYRLGDGTDWTDPDDWAVGTGDDWVTSLTTLPKLVRITAYITDSNGIFLSGNPDPDTYPFCGNGVKFVHVVTVGHN